MCVNGNLQPIQLRTNISVMHIWEFHLILCHLKIAMGSIPCLISWILLSFKLTQHPKEWSGGRQSLALIHPILSCACSPWTRRVNAPNMWSTCFCYILWALAVPCPILPLKMLPTCFLTLKRMLCTLPDYNKQRFCCLVPSFWSFPALAKRHDKLSACLYPEKNRIE